VESYKYKTSPVSKGDSGERWALRQTQEEARIYEEYMRTKQEGSLRKPHIAIDECFCGIHIRRWVECES
jgi:hypothetical protein